MDDCNHYESWVEVITYREIYRHCVKCNKREVQKDGKWI